jgi:small subunit ribosomal protein S1
MQVPLMNEPPPSSEPTPASTVPPAEPEEEGPSTAFARALAEHEAAVPAGPESATREVARGDAVKGTVVSIGDSHALIGYGGRSEAIADLAPFRAEDGSVKIAVGDTLELYVIETGDQVVLAPSLKGEKGEGRGAMTRLREAHRARVPVTGKVTGLNSGGLEVDLGGARGFCPLSQIENGFCADPAPYVGRSLEFMITKLGDAKGGVVLSRRQLLRKSEAEAAKERLATLKPGDELEGRVRRLEAFGAFVDLGGLDGLVHVSEVSHSRLTHPKDVLREGQHVKVRVLRIEPDVSGKSRIGLSIKAALPDPWEGIEQRFQPGQTAEGVVARLTDFGAFVTVAPGIDGLVHVSEAALGRVRHVKDVLAPGDKVQVVVKSIDAARHRMALSVREALGGAPEPTRKAVAGEVVEGRVGSVKPFGVFVDLPEFGARASALMPREETGEPRGADLAARFKVGETVRVEMLEPKEGKLRARLAGLTPAPRVEAVVDPGEPAARVREPRSPRGSVEADERGSREGRGRGGRPSRGRDRGERRERGERAERDGREGRGGREERGEDRGIGRVIRATSSPVTGSEGDLSPMALALRKAMEEARRKQREP